MNNLRLKLSTLSFLACSIAYSSVSAEVILDGTVGRSGAVNGPVYAITSDLGTIAGTNLFHSFSKFNLARSETAQFSGSSSITNIISRVTGGASSSIDGTLRSTIQGANFYLVNPTGVMFGPTANIDISGAFYVTTADYLKLGDNGRFDAKTPANSVLTSSSPSAFGFVSDKPTGVTIEGSGSSYSTATYGLKGLTTLSRKPLGIIAGDIAITSGTLDGKSVAPVISATDANMYIVSVASPGVVSLSDGAPKPEGFASMGSITTGNGSLLKSDGKGLGSGNIYIIGGRILSETTTITAETSEGRGGDVYITADSLAVTGGILSSAASGTGTAGDITINATGSVTIEGTQSNGAMVESSSRGDGPAGNIAITAQSVKLSGGGYIGTNTTGKNHAGTIAIKAGSIDVSGYLVKSDGTPSPSFISSETRGTGDAGRVALEADTVKISNGGNVSTSTYAATGGKSGDVYVNAAKSLTVTGMYKKDTKFIRSSIRSDTYGSGAGGGVTINAGNVEISDNASLMANSTSSGNAGHINISTTGGFTVTGTGLVSSESSGSGSSGNIGIVSPDTKILASGSVSVVAQGDGAAGSISLLKGTTLSVSGGTLSAVTKGNGEGGSITVQSGSAEITDGSIVIANTTGTKNAGNVLFNISDRLLISGSDNAATTVSSSTFSSGSAGSVEITASELSLLNRANILASAETNSTGNGGNIVIKAGKLYSSGATIAVDTKGSGNGGNLSITSNTVTLENNASVSSQSSSTGTAGNISLAITDKLSMKGSSISTATLKSDGGGITIDPRLIDMVNSQISTSVRGGTGDGGDITLIGGNIVLQRSKITANAEGGNGGNINITTQVLVSDPDSSITASSRLGLQGSVIISSPVVDLGAGLADMPDTLLNINALIPKRCAQSEEEISSFVIRPASGAPREPEEPVTTR